MTLAQQPAKTWLAVLYAGAIASAVDASMYHELLRCKRHPMGQTVSEGVVVYIGHSLDEDDHFRINFTTSAGTFVIFRDDPHFSELMGRLLKSFWTRVPAQYTHDVYPKEAMEDGRRYHMRLTSVELAD